MVISVTGLVTINVDTGSIVRSLGVTELASIGPNLASTASAPVVRIHTTINVRLNTAMAMAARVAVSFTRSVLGGASNVVLTVVTTGTGVSHVPASFLVYFNAVSVTGIGRINIL